jgi:hypothetical protein
MFSQHPKALFWSDINFVKPNEVALNSHKKFWFDCECGHTFESCLKNINLLNRWSPYCCNKKLCDPNKNCKICFDKCFASIDRSNYWSNKNQETPCEVFKNSHKKYWFNCDECGHEFMSSLSDLTSKNSWCPYCANRLLCNETTKCNKCYNKSFASIEKSKNWSVKNKKKPIEIFKSTSEIFIFDCDKCGNEFKSKLSHITDGSWCPNCRYKTEDIVYYKLKENYPLLQRQYKVDWCKDKKHLPFDFVIEERKIIVEVDG